MDRIISYEEINGQNCDLCGRRLTWEFVPTRAKAQVFAQDTPGLNPEWTGPKQRRRWLRDRGLVDYEGASAEAVDRQHKRDETHREEVEDAAHLKATMEMLDELGDAGLYTHEHFSRDENLPDPDLTGAGTFDSRDGEGPLFEEAGA